MRVFLCHSNVDSDFVLEVAKHLRRCITGVYCYETSQRVDEEFQKTIKRELHDCELMVIFIGVELTEWQEREVDWAWENHDSVGQPGFCTYLLRREDLPKNLRTELKGFPYEKIIECDSAKALRVAADIARKMETPFFVDGLPLNPHLFDYEKDIIEHFEKVSTLRSCSFDEEEAKRLGLSSEDIERIHRKWLDGCPAKWPEVVCWKRNRQHLAEALGKQEIREWQEEFGNFRKEGAAVVPAALSTYHQPTADKGSTRQSCLLKQGLLFPEAGPREFFLFPQGRQLLKVGILVSGGIAPGINAVIDGIVERHHQYADKLKYNVDVIGLLNGFRGLENLGAAQHPLHPKYTQSRANEGGSILGTSRVDELLDMSTRQRWLESIVMKLFAIDIDILYIIGGDGSMKAAHAIWSVAQEHAAKPIGRRLSVVTIPKTMDNDVLWVWQAFGFLSAVEEARRVIEDLATEVHSNPRLCVVQLFGSDSGFVVSHAVHASVTKQCDVALIPEVDFSMKALAKYLRDNMMRREEPIPRGLVIMAETAIPKDALEFTKQENPHYVDTLSQKEIEEIEKFQAKRKKGKRIQGQTNDELRSAGLKIVTQGLKKLLTDMTEEKVGRGPQPRWKDLRVFANEPRHLLRAIRPSCTDIIMGNRLGTLAVDNAIAGYTDFMISQWLTEYVLIPLELVVLGRKRIPKSGIFWKSTIAKTGQPAALS